jgi:hypothetical protein
MQPESKLSTERELVAHVRAELERSQPDWLRIAALAERALQLAEKPGSPRVSTSRLRPDVEDARARADAALDEVRPIVVEADALVGADNMARVCLEHAEESYRGAVAAATDEAALDGFRLATESANAALDHAVGLRAQAPKRLRGEKAGNLLRGFLRGPSA